MPDIRAIIFELRGMLTTGHFFRLIPLSILAPLLSLWPYFGSPFIPAALAVLLTLEPFYNNMLNIWPGQMTSAGIFPTGWESTLRRRNIAVIFVTWAVLAYFTALVAYVQPEPPAVAEVAAFILSIATMQFPLLMIGNSFSWQQIRAGNGWGLEDAAAALTMLIGGSITSLPYLVINGIPGDRFFLVLYTTIAGASWWYRSIPGTARAIHERYPDLWQQTHLTSF